MRSKLAENQQVTQSARQQAADELRLKLMQQHIDYNDFVKWFNGKYGGTTSPEEMLTKVAVFEGTTATLGGSLMALPEGIPLTVGAAILWLAAGYDLATADPGTAHIP
jgi:sporulation-control protein spo0M